MISLANASSAVKARRFAMIQHDTAMISVAGTCREMAVRAETDTICRMAPVDEGLTTLRKLVVITSLIA